MQLGKIKSGVGLFVSVALWGTMGLPLAQSAQKTQASQKSSSLQVLILMKEGEDPQGVCARARGIALKKIHSTWPHLKIQVSEQLFASNKLLPVFRESASATSKPDVVLVPGDETLLGQLEPLLPRFEIPIVFLGSADSESSFHISPYIFPMGASVRLLARSSAEFMERMNHKRVVLLREVSSDLDLLWAAQLQSALARKSSSIKVKELLLHPGADLQKLTQEIVTHRPDIVFTAVSLPSLNQILSQFKVSAVTIPVLAHETRFDFATATSPENRVGHWSVSDFSAEDSEKRVRFFVDEFVRGSPTLVPDRNSFLCYDALVFVAQAAANRKNASSLAESMLKTHDFEGLMGKRIYSSSMGVMRNIYFSRTQKEGLRLIEKAPLP